MNFSFHSPGSFVGAFAARRRVRHPEQGEAGGGAATVTESAARVAAEVRAHPWCEAAIRVGLRFRLPLLIGFHLVAFATAYLFAFVVRFEGNVPPRELAFACDTVMLVVVLKLACFLAFRGHRGCWRYATFADLVVLLRAATLGSAALLLAGAWGWTGPPIPRSILLMDWGGTLLVVGGIRGSTRLVRERFHPMVFGRRRRRALIVGATEGGVALARAIQAQESLGLQVVGFLDANSALRGRDLMGIEVIGSPADVRRLAARNRVSAVLVPTPAPSAEAMRSLVADCAAAGVRVQLVPGVDAMLSGAVSVRPRDVDIHDLLCRDPVRLDCESIAGFLSGRVILVTGAAGSIGSEICRQVLAFRPSRLVLLDHNENGLFFVERELRAAAEAAGAGVEVVVCIGTITDAARIRAICGEHRPAVVFHAAAHKHVPMMESNPGEAVKNNVFGTRVVADESARAGVEAFVMVSTDKAVNPTSVMGACKRLAEMYVQSLAARQVATRMVTVRFGNVLGSNGSVIPVFKEQIARGGPVTVTHPDMTRYFMTIAEAAQLVLQAGALGKGGEIFVLDMGEPVRVLDLARDLIRLSGLREGIDIEIAFTGMRPGEKLYEELYESGEARTATPHSKIFAARHRPSAPERLRSHLSRLAVVVAGPTDDVVSLLKEFVPGYGFADPEAVSTIRPERSEWRAHAPSPVASRRARGVKVAL